MNHQITDELLLYFYPDIINIIMNYYQKTITYSHKIIVYPKYSKHYKIFKVFNINNVIYILLIPKCRDGSTYKNCKCLHVQCQHEQSPPYEYMLYKLNNNVLSVQLKIQSEDYMRSHPIDYLLINNKILCTYFSSIKQFVDIKRNKIVSADHNINCIDKIISNNQILYLVFDCMYKIITHNQSYEQINECHLKYKNKYISYDAKFKKICVCDDKILITNTNTVYLFSMEGQMIKKYITNLEHIDALFYIKPYLYVCCFVKCYKIYIYEDDVYIDCVQNDINNASDVLITRDAMYVLNDSHEMFVYDNY
jgi:hypothetical protein